MRITNNFDEIISTPELKIEVGEKINEGDLVVGFTYTDYGGDFYDKVCVEYFAKNYPDNFVWEHTMWNGKNGILFGDVVKDFKEVTERYLLGFEDLEEFYYEMERNVEHNDFTRFLDDIKREYKIFDGCMEWLIDNRSGHYNVLTTGLDFSEQDLIETLINEKLIQKIED